MTAWYNENDPYAAQWLRNLIKAGHIAAGDVDERSIEDVQPRDLERYTQCHFFAGIGVWSYALRQAGWRDDRPVWTGSCPCQPFSIAGKGKGHQDERHLWPSWFRLIREHSPDVVFGEQVSSKHALTWFDTVSTDLENEGYAVGAIASPAGGIGAPHIRQRLYFVADADEGQRGPWRDGCDSATQSGPYGELAGCSEPVVMGDADDARSQGRRQSIAEHDAQGWEGTQRHARTAGFWDECEWLWCRDGKYRPVEPGSPPLVDVTPARVGRLRAYGNAIVASQATEFIKAYLDVSLHAT